MNNSKIYKLNNYDLLKGLIVAVITAILTALLQMLTLVPPSIDWKQIGIISITSAISYLLKQLATDDSGDIPILKVGGRKRRKKKPNFAINGGFNFTDLDFSAGMPVWVFSDTMSETQVTIVQTINYINNQDVIFTEPISYNDFESLYFEID